MDDGVMRQAPLLSIVIPAHNVSAYIEKCLKSALDVDNDEVEVVLVDDGSTDDTLQVARRADPRGDCVVIAQENVGLGAARNAGLMKARGEYVWFVDGDDWLKPGAVVQVLCKLQETRPDVLVVDFTCADETGQSIQWIRSPFQGLDAGTMAGSEFFARYHATTYAFLYVTRRGLMLDHCLRFQPRINMQDAELIPRVLAVADHVLVSGIDAYVYVRRSGSFINSRERAVRERYFESVLEVRRRLRDFLSTVADPLMKSGLEAKLDGLSRILLMSYVYEAEDIPQLRRRLDLLGAEGVYPFPLLVAESARDRLLRHAVNRSPQMFPLAFRWLRASTAGIRSRLSRRKEHS